MDSNKTIRFSEEDLQLFSRASGDRNPLHLSTLYASRTAYGEQVVFGALGCLACLGSVSESSNSVKRVTADFQRPMFLHIDYRIESTQSGDSTIVRLFDGSTPVLTLALKFSAEETTRSLSPKVATFPLSAPRNTRWRDLSRDLTAEGVYRCEPSALQQLCERWSLQVDPLVVEALLWSSYFVGMELPGERALFFRAVLEFHGEAQPDLPLRVQSTIIHLSESLAQVRSAFTIHSGEQLTVSGQLTSFVRPDLPPSRFSDIEQGKAEALSGKVAIVVGASRGLGAALAMTLAADGARVIAISRSKLPWILDFPGAFKERIVQWEVDATDLIALASLAKREGVETVDFLVCSAFPAIPSLRLEPSAASRIQDYIRRATDLVLTPMCAFLPHLRAGGGCMVLISSVAVINPVRDWPHYVAAKSAVEAFCRISPMQFPETSALIVRPERLLTDMTNTPMGRKGATSPLILARQIATILRQPPPAGTCEVSDQSGFGSQRAVKTEDRIAEPSLR